MFTRRPPERGSPFIILVQNPTELFYTVYLRVIARQQVFQFSDSFGVALFLGGHTGELHGALEIRHELVLADQEIEFGQDGVQQLASIRGVVDHVLHDGFHGHGFFLDTPAIVIGGHAYHLVGDFRFPGEFRFGQGGHVDDISTPRAVHVGFGPGGELRALHTDRRLILMELGTVVHDAGVLEHEVGKALVERIGEPSMRYQALAEKGRWAQPPGAVDELVG